jgi:hypothetical protein
VGTLAHINSIRPVRCIPTDVEYLAHTGGQTQRGWERLADGWRCPGCGRSKRELMVWGASKSGCFGWKACVYTHYDHGTHTALAPRFSNTVICGAGKSADAIAKNAVGAPTSFSFSPAEIRQFIIASPNAPHRFDFDAAKRIYERLRRTFPPDRADTRSEVAS